MKLYRVEIFEDNNWIILSRHKNEENAIINADVKAMKVPARVIHDKKVIYERSPKNEL